MKATTVRKTPYEVANWLQRTYTTEELYGIIEGIYMSGVASTAKPPKTLSRRKSAGKAVHQLSWLDEAEGGAK